jgi:hypothetical protein
VTYAAVSFQLVDLNAVEDMTLRAHRWSVLMEMMMKHRASCDMMALLESLTPDVLRLLEAGAGAYVATVLGYAVCEVAPEAWDTLCRWVDACVEVPEVREGAMRMIDYVREQDIEQGIQQGMQLGVEQGMRMMVLRLIAEGMASDVVARIAGLDEAVVLAWLANEHERMLH